MDKKLDGLQGLRFVAAALVVVTHATLYTSERLGAGHFGVWTNGTRGVDVFFVISGFVMIWSSQKLIGTADGWRIFATKRIRRIVPLYWLATTAKLITLIAAAGYVLHATFDIPLIIKSYFFLPARKADGSLEPLLGVGWTLTYEMFFYALFAIALATRRNIYAVVGGVLAGCWFASYFVPPDYPAWMAYFNSIVVEFFLGMMIAAAALRGWRLPAWLAGVCVIVGFAYNCLSPSAFGLSRLFENGISSAMVVAGVVSLEPWLRPKLPSAALFLGNASFAIYLFHPLTAPAGAVILAKLHILSPWASVALCWVIGVAAGSVVYRFVEPRLDKLVGQRRPSVETGKDDASPVA